MIITRTPYRVSFLGGATDYESWYREHGGAVLTSTINYFTYICARFMPPFLGTKYRVFWSKMETVNRLEEIQHPGVRACLQYMGIDQGIEINHAGDLPARTGLGSSSAFTVGMLHALYALQKLHVTKAELADQAIVVEQRVLAETVGIQDQIECAHGGLNWIEIKRDGSYQVSPVSLSDTRLRELEAHCMLFYTGLQRHASQILGEMRRNATIDQMLLSGIAATAKRGLEILTSGRIEDFGAVLHEAWVLKCALSNLVSTKEINEMYERALHAGALGGKLLGAGSGGFLLIFAAPRFQGEVREALHGLLEFPFAFEHFGTQIVHAT